MADNPVWDDKENVLRIMKSRCDTCIFGRNSIILPEDRDNLVARANSEPMGNVICHKTIKLFIGDGEGAICNGWWRRFGVRTLWGRLAILENVVRWCDQKATGGEK